MIVAPELPSAKPYLLRAMYEWCCDQGMTPYAAVFVDEQVQVPMQFVKDGSITLNIGHEATNSLVITNDSLEFKGRFGGVAKDIMVPVTHVMALYGRETGEGMAFPISDPSQLVQPAVAAAKAPMPTPAKLAATPTMTKEKKKPTLTRIK
jgi:stringent starvation protein B